MDRTESTGFGVAFLGHAAFFGALYWLYQQAEGPPLLPAPMEVSFVEEVGPVSSAPDIAEPAPSFGEMGSPEEASGATASAPITAPIPEPVRPPVETGDRRRPDLTRNPITVRPAAPPRVAAPQRPPAQPGQGRAQRTTGFDPRRLAESLGRGPPEARGAAPAPRGAATAQERTSFTSALAAKIARCSRQQRPSTQEARSLRPIVVIRLRQDGSLDGAPVVRSVEGLNETNRQYETQAREAIVRAVRNCAPYTGLPPELYSVPNGWRQPPPIRLNFQ